jgi:hypothetical protein
LVILVKWDQVHTFKSILFLRFVLSDHRSYDVRKTPFFFPTNLSSFEINSKNLVGIHCRIRAA